MLDTTYQAAYESNGTIVGEDLEKEVLQHNRIGVLDNFFSLGGDSIKVLKQPQNVSSMEKR